MTELNHSRNLAVRPRAGCFDNLFLLTVLMAGLCLIMPTGTVTAQAFTTLRGFTGGGYGEPSELILSGSTLYGATGYGGSSWGRTVFKVNTHGTGFTNIIHNFNDARPVGGLVLTLPIRLLDNSPTQPRSLRA